MSAVLGERTLDWFEATYVQDEGRTDLTLMCLRCEEHLCDIGHRDSLASLVSLANDHICNDAYSVPS